MTYTFKAIPALLTPVILLGGIYGGAVTPTEAGAVAGAYALIVSVLVYRMLNWESLKKITAGNSEDCRHGFHNRGLCVRDCLYIHTGAHTYTVRRLYYGNHR